MLKKSFLIHPKKGLFNILQTTKYSVVQNFHTSYCIITNSVHIVYNIKIFVNKKIQIRLHRLKRRLRRLKNFIPFSLLLSSQKALFIADPAGETASAAVAANDPVTRHCRSKRIFMQGLPDRATGTRMADLFREPGICPGFPVRNSFTRCVDFLFKLCYSYLFLFIFQLVTRNFFLLLATFIAASYTSAPWTYQTRKYYLFHQYK